MHESHRCCDKHFKFDVKVLKENEDSYEKALDDLKDFNNPCHHLEI